MTQVELALPLPDPRDTPHEDPAGFRIGWDHAHYGLVPPAELLLEGTPIGQGWRAARAVFAGRAWPATRHTRAWLALRLEAWRVSAPFDLSTVTPNHLAQIEVRHCAARRVAFGGAADSPDAPCISRLNVQAGFAAGNLVMLSRAAQRAWSGLEVHDLVRRARAAEAAQGLREPLALPGPAAGAETNASDAAGLDAAVWWRLAALRSFATPMPDAEAARLPLAVLPPNRVRLLNTAQALQALLTLGLAHEGWAARMSAFAASLPAHSLRTDFNLWVGALAPRLLEAQAQGRDLHRALEDAALAERVLRRWQHFVLALGAPACESLVRRLAAQTLPGRQTIVWPVEQALDGWALRPLTRPDPTDAKALAAPPADRRRTARSPFVPPLRGTTGPRPAAR